MGGRHPDYDWRLVVQGGTSEAHTSVTVEPSTAPAVPWRSLLAIDPGPEQSALVVLEARVGQRLPVPRELVLDRNDRVIALLRSRAMKHRDHLVVEMIASYGMAVGASVFETCVWIGRFVEAWGEIHWSAPSPPFRPLPASRIERKRVKLELCGSARAKDANVRQRLLDLYGPTRAEACGTKRAPGPLYGVKRDLWAALAVGVAWTQIAQRAPRGLDCREGENHV